MESKVLHTANIVRKYFEVEMIRRGEQVKYAWLVKNPPDYIIDLIKNVHGDLLPDDYKFRFIVESLDAIIVNKGRKPSNFDPDVYNSDLLHWIGSSYHRASFIDDASYNLNLGAEVSLFTRLKIGQAKEKEEVCNCVYASLQGIIDRYNIIK